MHVPLSRGPGSTKPGSLLCRQPAGPHAPAACPRRGWLRSPCCPQVSVLARLPALGLRVLQLHKSFDDHATLKSSVRLYLHGRDLPVRKQEAVPVHVFPGTADDFCLESQLLQACFTGRSGLLQVSAGVGWGVRGEGGAPSTALCGVCSLLCRAAPCRASAELGRSRSRG